MLIAHFTYILPHYNLPFRRSPRLTKRWKTEAGPPIAEVGPLVDGRAAWNRRARVMELRRREVGEKAGDLE